MYVCMGLPIMIIIIPLKDKVCNLCFLYFPYILCKLLPVVVIVYEHGRASTNSTWNPVPGIKGTLMGEFRNSTKYVNLPMYLRVLTSYVHDR